MDRCQFADCGRQTSIMFDVETFTSRFARKKVPDTIRVCSNCWNELRSIGKPVRPRLEIPPPKLPREVAPEPDPLEGLL